MSSFDRKRFAVGMIVRSISAIAFLGILCHSHAHAATITVVPTSVNRIINHPPVPSQVNTVFLNEYFSTYTSSRDINQQRSLVYTSGSTFHNALVNAVGSNYVITSVTLTAGTSAIVNGYGPYETPGGKGVYSVLTSYNPSTVTWSNFNSGGVAGVNYANAALATGAVNSTSKTTTWTLSPSLIDGWITSPSSNLGLFFPDYGTPGDDKSTTQASNVVWTVTAVVPEPSTYALALAGVACGGFSMWRRRKRA